MNGEWNEVRVIVPKEFIEPVSSIFYDMDVKGLSIEDPDDLLKSERTPVTWDYVDINIFKEGDDKGVIKAYFPDTENIEKQVTFIKGKIEGLKDLGFGISDYSVDYKNVNEEDWANSWKKYYKPMRIGKNIIIKPLWEKYDAKDTDIVIEMDPGMAFGTGTHETTRMCVLALEENIRGNERVIDIGTGSGILAIVSSKLGASEALAIDLDPVAVDSAKINTELNRTSNVKVREGNLLSEAEGTYDVVIANIIADVIMIILKDIGKITHKGSRFIASGIISLRLDEVLEKIDEAGLKVIEIKRENDWCCIISEVI